MGLLDSVLGSVLGGQQSAGDGQGNGLAGILGSLLSNPQLMQALAGLLGNDGSNGGVGGLIARFQQAGLGDAVDSWVGSGENQTVSGQQIGEALGADTIADVASKIGTSPSDTADQLSQLLPGLLDQLTPAGRLPEGGLGNSGELMGMLGSLLAKR